ncbi:unnamed protein product [Amoebophrya sp. A120]|nr:unnamed protein product [Amoebophrya sp. A120]|eukprot:GSA120T00003165001.1
MVEGAALPFQQQDPSLVDPESGTISPALTHNFDDLVRLIELANKNYKVRTQSLDAQAARDYQLDLDQRGWKVLIPIGTDEYGLVAHSPNKSLIVLAFAGSCGQTDWETNLHCRATYSERHRGDVHTGYLARYDALRDQLLQVLASLQGAVTQATKILVTGHSCGGAVAQLALGEVVSLCASSWFGREWSNVLQPKVFGYFLSSPMAVTFATGAYEYLNAIVGEKNMASQFPEGDLVAATGWDATIQGLLRKLSQTKETDAAAMDLFEQLQGITWVQELQYYRPLGRFLVQTVSGGMVLQKDFGNGASASMMSATPPSSSVAAAGMGNEDSNKAATEQPLDPDDLYVWDTFRQALADCGLAAHLGGRNSEREFVRWITEPPSVSLLEKGNRLWSDWNAKTEERAEKLPPMPATVFAEAGASSSTSTPSRVEVGGGPRRLLAFQSPMLQVPPVVAPVVGAAAAAVAPSPLRSMMFVPQQAQLPAAASPWNGATAAQQLQQLQYQQPAAPAIPISAGSLGNTIRPVGVSALVGSQVPGAASTSASASESAPNQHVAQHQQPHPIAAPGPPAGAQPVAPTPFQQSGPAPQAHPSFMTTRPHAMGRVELAAPTLHMPSQLHESLPQPQAQNQPQAVAFPQHPGLTKPQIQPPEVKKAKLRKFVFVDPATANEDTKGTTVTTTSEERNGINGTTVPQDPDAGLVEQPAALAPEPHAPPVLFAPEAGGTAGMSATTGPSSALSAAEAYRQQLAAVVAAPARSPGGGPPNVGAVSSSPAEAAASIKQAFLASFAKPAYVPPLQGLQLPSTIAPNVGKVQAMLPTFREKLQANQRYFASPT